MKKIQSSTCIEAAGHSFNSCEVEISYTYIDKSLTDNDIEIAEQSGRIMKRPANGVSGVDSLSGGYSSHCYTDILSHKWKESFNLFIIKILINFQNKIVKYLPN